MELATEGGKRGRKPGQRRRTPLEIQRDRTLINDLRLLRRKSLSEIALIISAQYLADPTIDAATGLDKDGKRPPHVGKKQVAKEIEGAIEDYKEGRADDIHTKRLELIRRYEKLAGYAIEEYEASKAPRVIKTETESTGGEAGPTSSSKEVVEPRVVGDPRFYTIAISCVDKVAELEAAIPPRKTALTNPDGTEPFKFEGLEELKRLEHLAAMLLEPQSGDKVKET